MADVRTESVDCVLIDLPTIRPHVLAMATMHGQTLMLVRIRCSDGVTGFGEGTTIGGLAYGDESPEGMKLAIDHYIAPLLLGEDATRPAAAMARVARMVVGNHFARSAVETALLDAMGRRAGLPLSELLGGRVRDAVPVLWTLASGDTARDIAEAEAMLAAKRHDAFKLKIGKRAFTDDVAHVAAIKRALGDRASVRVDVNMAWDEATARRAIPMLADAGCDLVEQPIARANRAGMARLRALSPIAIMADETIRGLTDLHDVIAHGAADVVSVKIEQLGGPRAARAAEGIAAAADVALYGGTMLEGGMSTIASAHVFATFATLPFGTELFGPLLLTEDILRVPLDYRDGALAVPQGPGLGIDLDEDRVAFFSRDGARRTISIPAGSIPATED